MILYYSRQDFNLFSFIILSSIIDGKLRKYRFFFIFFLTELVKDDKLSSCDLLLLKSVEKIRTFSVVHHRYHLIIKAIN